MSYFKAKMHKILQRGPSSKGRGGRKRGKGERRGKGCLLLNGDGHMSR